MKLFNLISFVGIMLATAHCATPIKQDTHRSVASLVSWDSCYNENNNRVYFMKPNSSTKCKSKTYFQGEDGYLMNDNLPSEDGMTINKQGSPRSFKAKNGSQYFISAWNNLTKADTLIVTKVDIDKKEAVEVCRFINHSIEFDVMEARGFLQISIRTPLSQTSDQFVHKWVNCVSTK